MISGISLAVARPLPSLDINACGDKPPLSYMAQACHAQACTDVPGTSVQISQGHLYRCPWDICTCQCRQQIIACTDVPGISVQMPLGHMYRCPWDICTCHNTCACSTCLKHVLRKHVQIQMSLGHLYRCPWDICTLTHADNKIIAPPRRRERNERE